MSNPNFPRLIDNDEGEITVTFNGVEVRGWSYANRDEQYLKMRMAREFCEGWHHGCDAGLARAKVVFGEVMADHEKIISGILATAKTGTSSDDAR